ncbi:hypothetical protein [Methylobacterium sp. WL116]|uniref:hypothetical protein n=1 Tax=Methylobacterium sp. WL116 TaxID=2603889 RepID=UPI0011C9EAEB|nr:hypothetical protein [Methylobacterium sp. WL116]TXM94947.1 hypothetical protein FV223_02740 [Methylobacterium sp. WL116]
MNSNRPWDLVTDPDYFRDVMGTLVTAGLGPKEDVWVRFGNTGAGKNPNYQVQGPDGRIVRYSGTTHKAFHLKPDESFEPGNLSEEVFAYPDVVKLLALRLHKA